MTLKKRPAWRTQWLAILFALALLLLPLAPLSNVIAAHLQAVFPQLAQKIAAFGVGNEDSSEIDVQYITLLALPFLAVSLMIMYRHYSWLYSVQAGNIESRHGIIAREIRSIHVNDLRNVNIKQSLFQRLIFVGDVEFSSAGSADVEVVFKGVGEPMRVKNIVQQEILE